jgi:hypothetical protein
MWVILMNLILYLLGYHHHSLCSLLCLVDTYQVVRKLKHVVTQTDDQELALERALFDVSSEHLYVLVVKGCVNLVHEVERRGLVLMKGEDKAEGDQGLLTTREVLNLLPHLPRRSHI